MARTLAPLQNAVVNAVWALGFLLLVAVGMGLGDRPILYGLFLLGPLVSAAFARQLSAVVLGVLGVYAGILLTVSLVAIAKGSQTVDWRQTFLQGAVVSVVDLALSVPVWWYVHRLRRRVLVATVASETPRA
jgi:uncharacterized membrane protein